MIFKQAFRVAFVALIWKQYKGAIISTVLLIIYLLLVKNIHADILLANTEAGGANSRLGLLILYKWLAYALGVLCYLAFHIIRGLRPSPKALNKSLKEKAKQANVDAQEDEDDPFAAIRKRKHLRSRADFLEGKD